MIKFKIQIETEELSKYFVSNRREFGEGKKFDGEGKVFGHTYFPGRGIGGDMFFDPDENWLLYPYNEEGSNLFNECPHSI